MAALIGAGLGYAVTSRQPVTVVVAAQGSHAIKADDKSVANAPAQVAAPVMTELLADLYDTWDEAGAVDRLAALSITDLQNLIKQCATMHDPWRGMQIACAAREAIGRTDFPLALRLAQAVEVKDDKDKMEAMRETEVGYLIGSLALRSPAEAVALAGKLEHGGWTSWINGSMWYRWLKSDLDGVLRHWDNDPSEGTGMGAMEAYLTTMPSSSMPGILARAATMKRADMRGAVERAVLKQWAVEDPAAAGRYALSLGPPATANDEPGREAIAAWVAEFPTDALSAIIATKPGPQRQAMLGAAVQQLKQSGHLEPLIDLLEQGANAELAAMIMAEQISGCAAVAINPSPAALNRLLAVLPEGAEKQRMMEKVAETWAYGFHFDEAIGLLAGIADDQGRRAALATVARDWQRVAPQAAQAWIGAFSPGADRDAAVGGLVAALAPHAPRAAAAWLPTITQPRQRLDAMRAIADAWRPHDRAGLAAWLATQPGMNRVVMAEMLGD